MKLSPKFEGPGGFCGTHLQEGCHAQDFYCFSDFCETNRRRRTGFSFISVLYGVDSKNMLSYEIRPVLPDNYPLWNVR